MSEMTMISAERMKSVVTAPLTIVSSSWAAASSSAACPWPETFSQIFSAPSKHRYVPPSMSNGESSHGMKALSSRIAGTMKSSLLRSDPIVIRLMIGSSRLGSSPST